MITLPHFTATKHTIYDVIIIGAGAAGLMCAIEAGKRGRSVLLLDHAAKPAEKIRISGGGRCNFTNLYTSPDNFLSQNPRFCVSALKRYTPHDFIALVEKYYIPYHEKTLGQLFCNGSSSQIIEMLLKECAAAQVKIALNTKVVNISKTDRGFMLNTDTRTIFCTSLVIATGGKSIPKMGATGFGYEIAKQFDLKIITPHPALVPLIFEGGMLTYVKSLAGVSLKVTVTGNKKQFTEGLLFTHRGLSGPAILQISSYLGEGDGITINLAPHVDVFAFLKQEKLLYPKHEITTALSQVVPKRLAEHICLSHQETRKLAEMPHPSLKILAEAINNWRIISCGTEGFRTAEVTLGGVDTDELSSKTFECKSVPGLYFIGEVVDVTGQLGGFNFQWAWASGHAAAQYLQ